MSTNCYRPAKASRAFLISSAFNRSVIAILSAGEKDREDTEGTKLEIKEQSLKTAEPKWEHKSGGFNAKKLKAKFKLLPLSVNVSENVLVVRK